VAEQFADNITAKADIASATGKAIITLPELPIITPRGRYDVEIFPSFFKLHGKSYNFKVNYGSIVRLFALIRPKANTSNTITQWFVLALEPAIRRGNTSYSYLIFQLSEEDKLNAEISLSDEYVSQQFAFLYSCGPALGLADELLV